MFGTGGALGTYLGGAWADRLGRRDPGRAVLPVVCGMLLALCAAFPAFLSSDWRILAVFYWVIVFGASTYLGPLLSLLQMLVGERHRATTVVITLGVMQILGVGLGPLLIGMASDLLRPEYGAQGLRWALLAGHAVAIVPALLFLRARHLIRHEIGTPPMCHR